MYHLRLIIRFVLLTGIASKLVFAGKPTENQTGFHVRYRVGPSKFGRGVFADQDIKKGTLVWQGAYGKNIQRFVNEAEVRKWLADMPNDDVRKEWLQFPVFNNGGFNLDVDDAKFINHSPEPNLEYPFKQISSHAKRDIKKGEELFEDYRTYHACAVGACPKWLAKIYAEYLIDDSFTNKVDPRVGNQVDVKGLVDSDQGDDDMGEKMEYPEYDDDVEVLNNLRSKEVRAHADAVCKAKFLLKKKRFDLRKMTSAQTIWSNNKNFVVIKNANKWTARIRCMQRMEHYIDDHPRSATYFVQVTQVKKSRRTWVCRRFKRITAVWKKKLKHPCGKYKCRKSDVIIALKCESGFPPLLRVTSTGEDATSPHCSWYNSCQYTNDTKQQCAEALCQAQGFDGAHNGGHNVVNSSNFCNGNLSNTDQHWVYFIDTDEIKLSNTNFEATITADCDTSALYRPPTTTPPICTDTTTATTTSPTTTMAGFIEIVGYCNTTQGLAVDHHDYNEVDGNGGAEDCWAWCHSIKQSQPLTTFTACEFDGDYAYCNLYNVTINGTNGDTDALCRVYQDEWDVTEWENLGMCSEAGSGLSCGTGEQDQTRICSSNAPETPCLPGYGVTERTVSCSEAGTLPHCSALVTSKSNCAKITSLSECSAAAEYLGLSNISAVDDGQCGASDHPPYCYFEGGVLKYNSNGMNTGDCTETDQCLCFTATNSTVGCALNTTSPLPCVCYGSICLGGTYTCDTSPCDVMEGNVFLTSRPICDDSWDVRDAGVVCRQLGFRGTTRPKTDSYYGDVDHGNYQDYGNFLFDEVGCSGNEPNILSCPLELYNHDCSTDEAAGVVCTGIECADNNDCEDNHHCGSKGLCNLVCADNSTCADSEHCNNEGLCVDPCIGYPPCDNGYCWTENHLPDCGSFSGCFDERTVVWSKNETQSDNDMKQILVGNLKEGDLVRTRSLKIQSNEPRDFTWTRATDVTIEEGGNWKSHSFSFGNGNDLTVTSPHIMIIWKNGEPYLVRGDQVRVGDVMIVDEKATEVKRIKTKTITVKVSIETEDGTIEVNGVLASGLCDDNPDIIHSVVKAKERLENYKVSHFGEVYNTMCMDTKAWYTAYMVNNGFSA